MRKIRKALSVVLASAMLISGAVGAESERFEGDINITADSWVVNYVTNRTKWNSEQDYAAVSNEHYNGNAGLCVNIQSPKEDSRYIRASNTMSEALEADSTYRISFWMKGNGGNFGTIFSGWTYRTATNEYTVETTDGEWKKLYKDVSVTSAPNGKELMLLFENNMNYVIDDISVKKVTEENGEIVLGNEIISNGGFEEYTVNPYDFDVSNETAYKSTEWRIDYNQSAMDFSKDYARPTKKYARSGNYAMYLNFESDKAVNWYYIVKNPNRLKLDKGEYVLEFWMKGTYSSNEAVRTGLFWNDNLAVGIGKMDKGITDDNGWTKYSKTFTLTEGDTSERSFLVLVQDKCSCIIDDIKLYNTENADVNLIADGEFESTVPALQNNAAMDNWSIIKSNITDSVWMKDVFVNVTQKEAHSGTNSFNAAFPYRTLANKFVRISQDGTFDAGNYHLSFYAKGECELFQIGLGWNNNGNKGLLGTNNSIFTKTEDKDGWVRYDADITLANKDTYFQIIIDRHTYDLYVDDIVLTKEGSEDNLIKNGGFENASFVEPSTELINPMAYAVDAGGMVNLSWTNPNNRSIEAIRVYVDGVESKNTIINKDASAFNEFLIGNLENNRQYEFKLVWIINGVEYEKTLTAIPDNQGKSLNFGKWKAFRSDTVNNKLTYYSNFNAAFDKDEKVSGNSSMRMDVNLPSRISNIYPNINQTVRLNTGKKYCIKFKAKMENINHFYLIEDTYITSMQGEKYHFWYSPDVVRSSSPVSSDWKEYTQVLAPTSDIDNKKFELYNPKYLIDYDANIKLAIDQGTGTLWIDDVGVYEIDPYEDEVVVISDNLLANGGFESEDYIIENPSYVLNVDGERFDTNVLEAGNMEFTVRIKNISAGDNFNIVVAAALYNGSKLVSVTTMERKIAELPYYIPADEFTANVNVPSLDGGDYKLKIMYWNGIDSITPIKDYDILTPEKAE